MNPIFFILPLVFLVLLALALWWWYNSRDDLESGEWDESPEQGQLSGESSAVDVIGAGGATTEAGAPVSGLGMPGADSAADVASGVGRGTAAYAGPLPSSEELAREFDDGDHDLNLFAPHAPPAPPSEAEESVAEEHVGSVDEVTDGDSGDGLDQAEPVVDPVAEDEVTLSDSAWGDGALADDTSGEDEVAIADGDGTGVVAAGEGEPGDVEVAAEPVEPVEPVGTVEPVETVETVETGEAVEHPENETGPADAAPIESVVATGAVAAYGDTEHDEAAQALALGAGYGDDVSDIVDELPPPTTTPMAGASSATEWQRWNDEHTGPADPAHAQAGEPEDVEAGADSAEAPESSDSAESPESAESSEDGGLVEQWSEETAQAEAVVPTSDEEAAVAEATFGGVPARAATPADADPAAYETSGGGDAEAAHEQVVHDEGEVPLAEPEGWSSAEAADGSGDVSDQPAVLAAEDAEDAGDWQYDEARAGMAASADAAAAHPHTVDHVGMQPAGAAHEVSADSGGGGDWLDDEAHGAEETIEAGEHATDEAGDEGRDDTEAAPMPSEAPETEAWGRRISELDEVRDGGFGMGSAAPIADGAQPVGHTIQAYFDTRTYRTQDAPGYDSCEPDVWFYDEESAHRAGFGPAQA